VGKHGQWEYMDKKNRKILVAGIFGLILLVIMSGCVSGEKKDNGTLVPQDTSSKDTSSKDTPKGVSSSTGSMLEKYDIKKLISMSDNIIIGDVSEVLPSMWNTPDGKRAPNDSGEGLFIYTDAKIKIGESLKGSLDKDTVVIRVLGGIVEPQGQFSEDQPTYQTNEKVLVFLKKDSNPKTKDVGIEHMTTTGLIQGKISISQNNEVIIGGEKMSLDDARIKITESGKVSQ